MLTPTSTRRAVGATTEVPRPSPRTAAAATAASTALAGLVLGVVAALADARGGMLADLLSVPGPWIAAAALVAVAASRAERTWTAPLSTAGFLVGGIVAYYLTKQATIGAIPGPLVALWGVLALTVGTAGGAAAARCASRPWGVASIAGAVAGWLVVEALVLPAAPPSEALAGVIGVGLIGRRAGAHRSPWQTAAVGAGVGAATAVCVFAVLSRALSAAL